MRIVVQRCSQAKCIVDDVVISEIKAGLMLLIGFSKEDYNIDYAKMLKKVVNMRIFSDNAGKMNLSVKDIKGEILAISQFTLYADCSGGNRPAFIEAMPYNDANKYYLQFVDDLNKEVPTKLGLFGADMKIEFINDGPVTIVLDSNDLK